MVPYHQQLPEDRLELYSHTGYTGSDSFTFKANDGTVDSNTAMVTITVKYHHKEPIIMHRALS